MDPLSHAVLGAAIGHGCFGRRLGWRAATWGALAAASPDIDVLLLAGGDEFDGLVTHRGITHSLLFVPVAGAVWGWVMHRLDRRRQTERTQHLGTWIGVIALAMLSHPLLDYLTPYGTQLLAPLSDTRFAWNAMPIIDPLYTLILIAGLVWARRLRTEPRARRASLAALALSTSYLAFGGYLNGAAERYAERELNGRAGNAEITAYPTLLQVFLRRIVARTFDEDRVGYVNMWSPCPINWGAAPRLSSVPVDAVLASREGRIFDWFSMNQLAATATPTDMGWHVVLADLRYGIDTDPRASIFAIEADVAHDGVLLAQPRMMPQVLSAADRRVGAVLRDVWRGQCERAAVRP